MLPTPNTYVTDLIPMATNRHDPCSLGVGKLAVAVEYAFLVKFRNMTVKTNGIGVD